MAYFTAFSKLFPFIESLRRYAKDARKIEKELKKKEELRKDIDTVTKAAGNIAGAAAVA